MKLSFIIPTLDEEKRIARVIKQFDRIRDRYEFEIIVGDGGSRDRTREIAESLGAKVFSNKRTDQNIAKNRNLGAAHATGDVIIFCDADTLIENLSRFAYRVTTVFEDKEIVAGMPKIKVFPWEHKASDRVYNFLYNNMMKVSFRIEKPFSSGQCQIVRRDAFIEVGGYDADMVHAEDSFLFKKLQKIGRLHYFDDLAVLESPRRYRKWGYLKLVTLGGASYFGTTMLKKKVLNKWKRVD